jgi:hypothetical protein
MKYTIYKNDVGQLMAMEGHCEFDGVISKCVDMSVSMEFFVEACARKQWEPQWFNETAVYTTGYNQAVDEINALKAENARLREALKNLLEDIKCTVDINVDFTIENTFDTAISTIIKASSLNKAREALKGDITPDKGES